MRTGTPRWRIGDWVYEVHERAAGIDLYREAISWEPLPNAEHARTAGRMLAALHDAADGYDARPARHPHPGRAQRTDLRARSRRRAAARNCRSARAWPTTCSSRDWPTDLAELLAPWHAAAQPRLAQQPRLWTHGDWHVSNLCWSDAGDDAQITAVLDFGLAAANFALFDLATAIERNAIAWLALDSGLDAAHPDIARALIDGYRQQRPLDAADVHLLADLLPLVHVDFALSEVEYYHAITALARERRRRLRHLPARPRRVVRHAAGQALLQAIRDRA